MGWNEGVAESCWWSYQRCSIYLEPQSIWKMLRMVPPGKWTSFLEAKRDNLQQAPKKDGNNTSIINESPAKCSSEFQPALPAAILKAWNLLRLFLRSTQGSSPAMTDFDWFWLIEITWENGWKDGKSIKKNQWEIYLKNHRISALLSPICVMSNSTNINQHPSAKRLVRPPNKELLAILASGLTLVQVDWFKSKGGYFKHLAWPSLLHQLTHLHWKKVISFKNCPTNDFQPSFASISCVLALHLGNPDSWSEAPANVKKGNSTWETNQHTTHPKFITRHFLPWRLPS